MSAKYEKHQQRNRGELADAQQQQQQQVTNAVATISPQYFDVEQIAPSHKARLYRLFEYVEKEFDALYEENCELRAKLNQLSERLGESILQSPEVVSSPGDPSSARKEAARKVIPIELLFFHLDLMIPRFLRE
ncbi:unnamed protein product [Gongylonema pulchrum]|uniref:Cnn_1N domain-containing protein n=1 Tax=Gongylonema pulchrum TaxID=637853 RepID=A0A183ELX8_9BILA|nr:unnamed protein product [Gongylonema pulchrum]